MIKTVGLHHTMSTSEILVAVSAKFTFIPHFHTLVSAGDPGPWHLLKPKEPCGQGKQGYGLVPMVPAGKVTYDTLK